MDDGVTVKADDIDLLGRHAGLGEQRRDRLGMRHGDVALHGHDIAPAAQTGAQAVAQAGVVGAGGARAGLRHATPVGAQQRGVDAVERGAAHQAERGPFVVSGHRDPAQHGVSEAGGVVGRRRV